MQQRQAPPQRLDVPGRAGHLVDGGGDEEIGLREHHRRDRRPSGRRAELAQPLGFVEAARPEFGHERPPVHLDQVGGASERLQRIDRPDGVRQAPAYASE